MYLNSKLIFNKKNVLSFILALVPISFIVGNMLININCLLLIISTIFFYRSAILEIKFHILDKLIFILFALIIYTGFYNVFFLNLENIVSYVANLTKSIFFIKYLLFYIILRFLIEKNIINLKIFFISTTFSVLFVCFDLFYQFLNGEDIFGIVGQGRKLSGPFGDELIAGSFIQRYSLFAFFLISLFYNSSKLNKFNWLIIPLLFVTFFSSIILSGNRMPSIIFLFSVFLIIIFQKNMRKFFIPFIIIFTLIFVTLFKFNETIKLNFLNLYGQVYKMTLLVKDRDFFNKDSPQYLKEFSSFYDTWLMNKYIGGGIKNFRFYCHHRPNIDENSKFICNMHPHNYYLEILTEIGIIGLTLVLIIFINILYLTLFKKYFANTSLKKNNLIIPFIFLFIAEIFPIKSTGSFFTTGNSTYLFLIIGIMIGLARRQNIIENNKY